MADGFFKRLLTRKNLVLGGQLAGLALAFSSKKVRSSAADAVRAAGGVLDKPKPDASPTPAVTAVKAAAPRAKRVAKAAVAKTPAKARTAVKRAADTATEAAEAAPAKVRAKPGPKPRAKSDAKPRAPRKTAPKA